ncbi:hypothetical protein CEXT_736481 [Caerostris extrusa]|uniref:Uncharacterized protein n=1 Tax=Caerostris extrusa TaxID=172846 RepID=A0AAV4MGN6_CAEEX|nr:hypothetical protein CEXT_736481 [Caerostris extrusa]
MSQKGGPEYFLKKSSAHRKTVERYDASADRTGTASSSTTPSSSTTASSSTVDYLVICQININYLKIIIIMASNDGEDADCSSSLSSEEALSENEIEMEQYGCEICKMPVRKKLNFPDRRFGLL